jgi:hypothetical protein
VADELCQRHTEAAGVAASLIKFADTAADVYARTGDRDALAAAVRATQLIDC